MQGEHVLDQIPEEKLLEKVNEHDDDDGGKIERGDIPVEPQCPPKEREDRICHRPEKAHDRLRQRMIGIKRDPGENGGDHDDP